MGGGWDEMLHNTPGVRGTPRAGVGHGRYPCELANGSGVSWGPQGQWVSSSFPQCSLSYCRRTMGSLSFEPCPKESLTCPHYYYFWSTKGGQGTITRGTPSHRLLWGHHWPLGKLSASDSAAGESSCPLLHPSAHTSCQILHVSQVKGFQQALPLQASEKQTSNWYFVVSHCFQKHLWIHLVCPQCGKNYLDSSKFCLNGRRIHNLLFY